MANTTKPMSMLDANLTERSAFNDVDASFTQAGFLVGKVGRRVEVSGSGSTEIYTFLENGVVLYALTLTYTDSSKDTLLSAERTA